MLNNYESATEGDIKSWIDQFHRDGYLFLPKFLTRDFCRELREDLDKDFARDENDKDAGFRLRTCLFERSAANLRLFDMDPMVKRAKQPDGSYSWQVTGLLSQPSFRPGRAPKTAVPDSEE